MRFVAPILILIAIFITASCNRTFLDERFYDKHLSNWTVIDDPDTVEIPSNWRVEDDGWLHQRSNIWGRRGDFLGRWYGTYLIAGDDTWKDYRLSVKAKPQDDDGFGVVFRFQDSEHFYRFFLLEDSLSGGPLTRLDKREGADYTEIWSQKNGYRIGKEILVEIEVVGDMLRVFIDGKPIFEVKDSTYKHGKIGLFCYSQSHQLFDDVRVVNQ
jgi:hypothetical protein